MKRATARAPQATGINAGTLYPIQAFIRASGISSTRIRAARAVGICLPKYRVGKRVFVDGADGIEFVKQLAQKEDYAAS